MFPRFKGMAMRTMAALIFFLSCWLAASSAYAQTESNLAAKIEKLLADKKYKEAIPPTKQLIELRQKSGKGDTPETLIHLDALALLYVSQKQYANAENLLKKILESRERVFGTDSKELINTLSMLSGVLYSLERTNDAVPLLVRALRIGDARLPPDDPITLRCASNLASAYSKTGQDAKAEPLLLRVLAAQEKKSGKDKPGSEQLMYDLASVYRRLGNYPNAERFYRRVLDTLQKARGDLDAHTLAVSYELAEFYAKVGNFIGAVTLYDRVIQGRERTLGPDDPETLSAVEGFARFYASINNFKGAEPLFLRLYQADLRLAGPNAEQTRNSFQNLAFAYFKLEEYAKAEPMFLRILEERERSTGRHSHESLAVAQVLGSMYSDLKQYAKAEEFYRRILDAPSMNDRQLRSATYLGLADLYHQQKKWQQARDFMVKHLADPSGAEDGDGKGVLTGGRVTRTAFIKIVGRIVQEGLEPVERNAAITFEIAQSLSTSQAAQSLRRMAVRSLPRDGNLEAVIRQHQDLSEEVHRLTVLQADLWNSSDNVYVGPFTYDSKTGSDLKWSGIHVQRNQIIDAQAGSAAKLASLNARLKELDAVLARQFPQYAELIASQPVSVADLQGQLLSNESLVLILDTGSSATIAGETFVWVVTKDRIRWARSDLDPASLTREVQALRCGLDEEAWTTPDCGKVLDVIYTQADAKAKKPLPFPHARAHQLYKALFGEIEGLIRDKHLLIVPTGALAQLPFHVLVTEAPSDPDPRKVAWLARKHAVTVLPAVSSLKTLRRTVRPSAGDRPMLGVGNPLLNGDPSNALEAEWVKLSRAKQACPHTLWQRVVGLSGTRRSVRRLSMRGGYADVNELRFQVPLHETADEVCAVAKDLKVGPDDILLGARATEAAIKQLNNEDRLRAYRVVYFATHGTMAGQIGGTSEPGLILTPPLRASELDDGYLSASEVAALKLDADWVILSACNTAAGGPQDGVSAGTTASVRDAEALSGLARAFIYAGARSLLVSHWAVGSASAAKLVSSAVGEVARDPKVGRAEALRRAMVAMIDRGEPRQSHPAHWAPFVLVGEGSTAR